LSANIRKTKPPHSLRNRILFRTFLFAFAASVAWQWYARDSYTRTLAALDAKLDAVRDSIVAERAAVEKEARDNGESLTSPEILSRATPRMLPAPRESEIHQFIYGFPTRSVASNPTTAGAAKRCDTYVWRGLFQSFEMYLNYGAGDDPYLVTVDSKHE